MKCIEKLLALHLICVARIKIKRSRCPSVFVGQLTRFVYGMKPVWGFSNGVRDDQDHKSQSVWQDKDCDVVWMWFAYMRLCALIQVRSAHTVKSKDDIP